MKLAKNMSPACPACARPMRPVAESVQAPTSSSRSYWCPRCRFVFSEITAIPGRPDRAMDLNIGPTATMH